MDQREKEILQLRKEGLTYREIGEKYHISGSRIRQILVHLKTENDIFDALEKITTRNMAGAITNKLKGQGIRSLEQLRVAYQNGEVEVGKTAKELIEKILG